MERNGRWVALIVVALVLGLAVGARYRDELVTLFGEAPVKGQKFIQKGVYFPNTEPLPTPPPSNSNATHSTTPSLTTSSGCTSQMPIA